MPSYYAMLVATVFVITMRSSISNQAPELVQPVEVPSDEGHSLRFLRSSNDTSADPSTDVLSSFNGNSDEHEERGFISMTDRAVLNVDKNMHDLTFKVLFGALRLRTNLDQTLMKIFSSEEQMKAITKFYNDNHYFLDRNFKGFINKNVHDHEVYNALKIGEARTWANELKYRLFERYCKLAGIPIEIAAPFERLHV